MKLSRVIHCMLLTAGCRGAYVQFQDCSESHDSSSLIPESFRASVERGKDTFDWKFDLIAGLTKRNSCEADLSDIVPRFAVVDYGNHTPLIPGEIVNKTCFTSRFLGSRSKFTIATSFNRSTLLDTYKTTFELRNSDNTTLSCVRAVLTPAVPKAIRLLGLWLPIITFTLACLAACWPVRQSTKSTTKNSLVARAIDVLAYIQFIFFSGALSLRYPGFFQPLVGLCGWSTLMLPTGVVERGSPYARSGVEDGIYEHNGTITGAPGLELLTQMTGSPVKSRSWMNTFVLSLIVFLFLYLSSYITHRLKHGEASPGSCFVNFRSQFKTQYWAVVRLFLSCFMLPLSAWATYQFVDGSIYGYESSAMALIVLILLSAGFYWSWSQDPEMASLVIQGPGSVGRNDTKGHKYCALVVFFLMMLRGCILGGLQTYNSVQVGLLLACEALHLASMVYWAGFSHFISLPGILSMTRIALFSLHIGFLPRVTDHSGRMLVAYIILCGHLVVLVFVFSIPTAFDLIKLAFSNHPCVISDVENDRGAAVEADASTSGDDNELAKYPLSHTSRSSRTLLDMIASRETKLFSHKSTARMSPELLSLFMRNVQGEDKPSHVCEVSTEFTGSSSTLVGSTQSDLEIQPATNISPDVLAAHLLSDNNTAIRSISTSHDLDRPVHEYFISTSHNTYLSGRQVATRSKLEGYVEALSKGCRSVEVDCWNGQRGQPIVKHGYSLTKSINFRDVVNTIKEYAFAASDLPLWLSLEVHCSKSQRDTMARIMVEVFGECLVIEPIQGHSKTLPSPNQLRGKILLKVKMPQGVNPQDGDEEDHDAANLDPEQNGDQAKPEWGVQVGPVTPQSEQEGPQEDLLQSLAIYGAGKRLPAPDSIDTHRNFIYSISETNLRKRINKEHTLGLTDTQHMVRVYPDPSRVNSSNFDPLECWKHGVQMAALNYQTDDFQMKLNDAMFAGSLGYILKAQPGPKQIRIAIDVLMVKGLQGLAGESPLYVELELLLPDMPGQKIRTTAVSAHGSDIVFDQNLDISMGTKYPHLAFLHWSIRRSSSRGSIHSGIAKVGNLKKGYRLLPLGGSDQNVHVLCKISVNAS